MKKIISVLMALIILACFSGCSSNTSFFSVKKSSSGQMQLSYKYINGSHEEQFKYDPQKGTTLKYSISYSEGELEVYLCQGDKMGRIYKESSECQLDVFDAGTVKILIYAKEAKNVKISLAWEQSPEASNDPVPGETEYFM